MMLLHDDLIEFAVLVVDLLILDFLLLGARPVAGRDVAA